MATIQSLRNIFARVGLPEQVITDNGRNFVSEEFKEFLQKNGIKHTTSAPYHSSTTDWLNVLDFCSTTELPIDQQQELLHIRRRLDVVPEVERINRDLQLELFLPTESSTSTETQNPTVLEAEPTPLPKLTQQLT